MTDKQDEADNVAKRIKGLLNFTVISRQDSLNVSAVVKEIRAYGSKQREEGFDSGIECRDDLEKHPIYCRGCSHCGEEGCCGPHEPCPSGRIIEKNRKEAYSEGFKAAQEMAAKIVEDSHKNCAPPMCEIANQIRAMKESK